MRDDAARHFASHDEMAAFLRARLAPRDHLLVKGSRGMTMEAVIRLLESDLPPAIRPGPGGAP
jgi:UDP-N-acetylmuramyl pentapeptide synthase